MTQLKEDDSWGIYKRLIPYLKGLWRYFAISVLAMLVVGATGPVFASLIKPIIDEGFVEKNLNAMTWVPLAIVGLFILRGIANYINEYTTAYLSATMVQQLRTELFAKMLRLPVAYFSDHSRGRLMSRITNDANSITGAGFNVITVIAKDGLTVVGLLVWLLYLDWQLTLITLVTLPVIAWCVRKINKRLRGLAHQSQQVVGQMTQVLTESIDGARVVRVYGGQAHEQSRLEEANQGLRRNVVKQASSGAISSAVTQLLIAISLSLILYFAARRAHSTGFSAGDFMSFLTAMLMMFDPIKRMTGVMAALQGGLAAAHSVFGFLDEAEEPDNGRQVLPVSTGDIEFDNVVFRYPQAEKNAINGMSLHIPQGTVVALVGESGCGKSTAANLLPRFYDADEGQVRIGGTDVRDYTLGSLRDQIAVVSQDVVLFNDTIANNIAYGQYGVAEADIIAAAKAANAWGFIEQLPEGLNTPIGEHGLKLSGGQRQRLAIARALLKDAPILILDEATSALDTESERLVQAALEVLMQNRTTVVIAHRLSTIEKADRIVVMHEGQIVETGRHDELMAQGGRYAALQKMQSVTAQAGSQSEGVS
ncbi:subfamily B ATP-binding cassette protein MsbA [Neisseria sp. HSC-16F19]|nr:lipid A export permease/ATP-binding protein MsbA [Neisseria sp. HSC-16F19]MCP2039946.1 subfamily B ATP-binding cassette protein MsbA [Neisseria sp. HSC-16F19]